MSVAFVICTEHGLLEQKSLLLALTLRKFGGRFKDAPLLSFAPRPEKDVSRETLERFKALNVFHQHLPLNTEFQDYPLANKPLASAYAEQNVQADILVFLDSDKLVLAEPALLELPPGFDIGLRPVDCKNIGVATEEDEQYEYWKELLKLCRVGEIQYVESTVDEQRIYGYWNSGLVAVRRSAGLFTLWAENFGRVMREGLRPKGGDIFFVEQSCLAASVMATRAKVFQFPESYNYPIHFQTQSEWKGKITDLRKLVSVHYHHILGEAENPLIDLLGSDEQSRCLTECLRTTGFLAR